MIQQCPLLNSEEMFGPEHLKNTKETTSVGVGEKLSDKKLT